MKIAIHVEADDTEVVGAGYIRDDTLSAFPLLWHSHPHVPVPQLQARKSAGTHLVTIFSPRPHTHAQRVPAFVFTCQLDTILFKGYIDIIQDF